jgi:hypothetical protein
VLPPGGGIDRERTVLLDIRNVINHVLLHVLLKCRYRARRRPRMVKCILAAESLFVKSGLIYCGRRHA